LPDDEMALSFDVGVDCHNFYPVSYEEVKELMKKKKWTPAFAPRN
jgi:calcineurin-like phosphoesterase family protein